MDTHDPKTDLDGRRCAVGAAVRHIPAVVFDRDGNESHASGRQKTRQAIIVSAVILLDGDTIVVGKPLVVS